MTGSVGVGVNLQSSSPIAYRQQIDCCFPLSHAQFHRAMGPRDTTVLSWPNELEQHSLTLSRFSGHMDHESTVGCLLVVLRVLDRGWLGLGCEQGLVLTSPDRIVALCGFEFDKRIVLVVHKRVVGRHFLRLSVT